MSLLNLNDIFQIAMEIEKNGEDFYRNLSDRFKGEDKEVGNLYKSLADEEIVHFKTFNDMLETIKKANKSNYFDKLPEDYREYLKSYTENIIFTNNNLKKESERISTISQALDQSIKRELDSILFYQEIKDLILEHEAETINNIITEERKHFLKLSKLKGKYK